MMNEGEQLIPSFKIFAPCERGLACAHFMITTHQKIRG